MRKAKLLPLTPQRWSSKWAFQTFASTADCTTLFRKSREIKEKFVVDWNMSSFIRRWAHSHSLRLSCMACWTSTNSNNIPRSVVVTGSSRLSYQLSAFDRNSSKHRRQLQTVHYAADSNKSLFLRGKTPETISHELTQASLVSKSWLQQAKKKVRRFRLSIFLSARLFCVFRLKKKTSLQQSCAVYSGA